MSREEKLKRIKELEAKLAKEGAEAKKYASPIEKAPLQGPSTEEL